MFPVETLFPGLTPDPVWRYYFPSVASPKGPFYEELGRRLAKARRAAKVTQGQLARTVGLSRTSVSNIEKGRQPVHAFVLFEFARILAVPVTELFPPATTTVAPSPEDPRLRRLQPTQRDWVLRVISPMSPKELKKT
jgi:transcriptional regulator with XRE-family HTH domain